MNFKKFRKKIDTYIEAKVDDVLDAQVKDLFEKRLMPEAKKYVQHLVKSRLKGLLEEALEESLADLANEFDLSFVSDSESAEQEKEPQKDVFEEKVGTRFKETQEVSEPKKEPQKELEESKDPDSEKEDGDAQKKPKFPPPPKRHGVSHDAIRLLAFIQNYRNQHGPDVVPAPSRIYQHLGYETLKISRLYTELQEEDWIQKDRDSTGVVIEILKPLEKPEEYL